MALAAARHKAVVLLLIYNLLELVCVEGWGRVWSLFCCIVHA